MDLWTLIFVVSIGVGVGFMLAAFFMRKESSSESPLTLAFAGVIDRFMPNAFYIVLSVVFLTVMVLDHIDNPSVLESGAKDILLLLIGTVLGGLLTALGGVLKQISKNGEEDAKSE